MAHGAFLPWRQLARRRGRRCKASAALVLDRTVHPAETAAHARGARASLRSSARPRAGACGSARAGPARASPSAIAACTAQPGSLSWDSREPAAAGERDDVGEDLGDAVGGVGQLKFTHAGRVEQPAAGGEPVHRAAGRRVASVGVVLADRRGRLRARPGERVDERRLADAGRADQRDGLAGAAPGAQRRRRFGARARRGTRPAGPASASAPPTT